MNAPMVSGVGVYFDGVTSARHEVFVVLNQASLQISGHDGRAFGEWPYNELVELSAPDDLLRLGRHNSVVLERLEIADKAFAAEIDLRAALVARKSISAAKALSAISRRSRTTLL